MKKTLLLLLLVLAAAASARAGDKLFVLQDNCVKCHLWCESSSGENSVVQWKNGVHFRPDAACADCHGGDRLYYLDFKKGHMGIPDKIQSVAMCEKCHQQEVRDHVARQASASGNGKKCTVSCTDCHGHHRIQKADGFLLNEKTCGACHPPDKAAAIFKAAAASESRMRNLEQTMEREKNAGQPVATARSRLEDLKRRTAHAHHSLKMAELAAYLEGEALAMASGIREIMDKRSPRAWRLQGLGVMAFLALVCALLIAYVAAINKK